MILAVAAPTLISQYTFNFNNFSIMYLFNGGGPGSVGGGAGSTDILISWIYRLTTGTAPQYSMAAAVTFDYLHYCHLYLYDCIQETTRI